MSEYKVLVVSTDEDEKDDLLDYAWGIMANAHGGNWSKATNQWQLAAEKWRDLYGKHLHQR